MLVKELFHRVIHEALMQMTEWYIESRHGVVNACKFGKHYERYLKPEIYEQFLTIYVSADWESNWRRMYATIDLFRKIARSNSNTSYNRRLSSNIPSSHRSF